MSIRNVAEYIYRHAGQHPERPALIAPTGQALSYAELWERSGSLAGGLSEAGLSPGDRVVVMIPMSLDLYVVLVALFRLGASGVFVDPWVGARQIADFAAYAEPRGFIGIGRSHLLRLLDRRLREMPLTVSTGPCLWRLPARHTLSSLQASAPALFTPNAESPALITFTTGSSGPPKGANRTHRYLLAQHQALRETFSYDDGEVDMPMFPVFALNNLALGITTVIPEMDFRKLEHMDPEPVLRQMQTHLVTTATGSPTFFDKLVEHASLHANLLPPLRRILAGGAPITDAQIRRWQQVLPDTEILIVYGSTEAEPVAHLTASQRLDAKSRTRPQTPGTCTGTFVETIEARVVRLHDGPIDLGTEGWEPWELPQGWIGELVVTGDHVCQDYYRNPEAVAANKIRDGDGRIWHRMGDTGYLDHDGRFWLTGRVHSTISRDGQTYHPLLIEQAARANDTRIQGIAAVGIPDPGLGEKVVVVVQSETVGALPAAIKRRAADNRLIVDQVIITSTPLPMDPRHRAKVDYATLRQQLLDGKLA